ncbi:MAG: EAL domain-containing protein [Ruminiclostridium sp.]|nr:EAL domain-containing protein [Ruminiclostridium sp.]
MKNVIELYKKVFSNENKKIRYTVIAVCAVLYIAICVLEIVRHRAAGTVVFTSSPIRSFLLLAMTLTFCKSGYFLAVLFSASQGIFIAYQLFSGNSVYNLSQLISVLFSLLGISLLYFIFGKINDFIYPIIVENSQHEGLVKEASEASSKALESEKKIVRTEKELEHLAYFDQLTQLPNRIKIKEDMAGLIESRRAFGLIFIGIDNFKSINESKGHDTGDRFLIETGKRISGVLDQGDVLGRLGGDEFIVISLSHIETDDCKNYADRIESAFSHSFNTEDGEGVYIKVSLGMTFYPSDGETVTDLLRNADIALNRAKRDGKNRYVLFNRRLQEEIDYRNRIAMLLPKAIENNEFRLVYQPQFFPDKQLRGFEALIRWNSPQLGFVSPVTFIPVAEETGFILDLGQWILNTACRKLKELTDSYNKKIIMSVNVSSKQFGEKNFIKTVTKSLNDSGADSSLLELEVTESFLLHSLEETAALLSQLKRMNIKVSIDDFGTGYSSLSYLRQLPLDTLKIDKSFIDVVAEEGNGKSIVNSIIQLAHILGMTVIAEGVEYNEQLDYLKQQTCDCIQGFLFSKPLESDDVDEVVSRYWNDRTVSVVNVIE